MIINRNLPDYENVKCWDEKRAAGYLPVDIGVAEITGGLLSKVDSTTSDQFESVVNLQFLFKLNFIKFD